MFRISMTGGQYYAIEVELEDDLENIECIAAEGDVVFLCDDLSTFQDEMNVMDYDITLVEG